MGSRSKIQKIRFLCDTPKGLTLKSKDGAGWSIAAARSFPKNFVFNDKSEKVRLELAIEVEEDQVRPFPANFYRIYENVSFERDIPARVVHDVRGIAINNAFHDVKKVFNVISDFNRLLFH